MNVLVLALLLIGGCSCAEQNQRDTTSVCVELQGRMPPSNQGRDNNCAPGMTSSPSMGQENMEQGGPDPYQQQYPPQMYRPGPPQMMQQGVPPPGMFMPPHVRGRAGVPPPPMGMMGLPPQIIIKRLEEELSVKDHQIAELKAIINQKHQGQDQSEYHSAAMSSQHRQAQQ